VAIITQSVPELGSIIPYRSRRLVFGGGVTFAALEAFSLSVRSSSLMAIKEARSSAKTLV
jgi:hypothetical protein